MNFQSTEVYLQADLTEKLEAPAAMAPPMRKRLGQTLGGAEDGRPPVQLCGVNAPREPQREASTRHGLHMIIRST